MLKKTLYVLLALSIGLNLGVIGMTIAQRSSRPGPPPPGQGRDRGPDTPPDAEGMVEDHVAGITRHLGLNEVQAQAIREIVAEHMPRLILLKNEAEVASRGLSEAFAAAEFDADSFQRRTAEVSRARAMVDSLSALILVEEAGVLTTEQRRRFAEVAPTIHNRPNTAPSQGGPPPGDRPPRDRPPPR